MSGSVSSGSMLPPREGSQVYCDTMNALNKANAKFKTLIDNAGILGRQATYIVSTTPLSKEALVQCQKVLQEKKMDHIVVDAREGGSFLRINLTQMADKVSKQEMSEIFSKATGSPLPYDAEAEATAQAYADRMRQPLQHMSHTWMQEPAHNADELIKLLPPFAKLDDIQSIKAIPPDVKTIQAYALIAFTLLNERRYSEATKYLDGIDELCKNAINFVNTEATLGQKTVEALLPIVNSKQINNDPMPADAAAVRLRGCVIIQRLINLHQVPSFEFKFDKDYEFYLLNLKNVSGTVRLSVEDELILANANSK